MSAPHLLSLADLHAAAPGVLDVVFGPDGDFEGAPRFTGPVWSARWGRYYTMWDVSHDLDGEPRCWVRSLDIAEEPWDDRHGSYVFDLRIPTVAARLAGLCARALRPRIGGTTPWNIEESDGGVWILCPARRHGLMWFWESNGMGCADAPTVRLPDDCDREGFLRALSLTLAPRIAALRKP